jgi:phosphoglycolate phosphatase-like HAD superfamily hydrolase
MRYILFDIDGTLTAGGDGGGAGSSAMNQAFKDLFATDNGFDNIQKAGKTDYIILKEGFKQHGIAYTPETEKTFRERYVYHLDRFVREDGKQSHRLPGAAEILDALRLIPEKAVFGLLTGNWSQGARIKLASVGLDHYFFPGNGDTPLGAFGEDAPTRPELVPVALQRYRERFGHHISADDTVLIGDTPRDVEAAMVNGIMAIAVTTGPFSADELRAAGADVVLDGIADTQAVLKLFLGDSH